MIISVTLQRTGDQQVELTCMNDGEQSIRLAAPRLGIGEFDGSYFEFEPRTAGYLGRSVKRASYDEADLVTLEGGGKLRQIVDLSGLYRDIRSGIRVRYLASHPLSGSGGSQTLLVSNWTTL